MQFLFISIHSVFEFVDLNSCISAINQDYGTYSYEHFLTQ